MLTMISRSLGKTAEAEAIQPQLFGAGQAAGILQGTHRIDQRIEQIEHHQRAVLIEVELAVGRLVAFATHLVQTGKQRQQMAEIFQSANILVR